ncbi:hypothetical protein SAMN04488168_10936 [Bacillus sp. 491mf]|nr:hypothetical protein SAMN04488168_10936 [Bacillus sp. 491mf]
MSKGSKLIRDVHQKLKDMGETYKKQIKKQKGVYEK